MEKRLKKKKIYLKALSGLNKLNSFYVLIFYDKKYGEKLLCKLWEAYGSSSKVCEGLLPLKNMTMQTEATFPAKKFFFFRK